MKWLNQSSSNGNQQFEIWFYYITICIRMHRWKCIFACKTLRRQQYAKLSVCSTVATIIWITMHVCHHLKLARNSVSLNLSVSLEDIYAGFVHSWTISVHRCTEIIIYSGSNLHADYRFEWLYIYGQHRNRVQFDLQRIYVICFHVIAIQHLIRWRSANTKFSNICVRICG